MFRIRESLRRKGAVVLAGLFGLAAIGVATAPPSNAAIVDTNGTASTDNGTATGTMTWRDDQTGGTRPDISKACVILYDITDGANITELGQKCVDDYTSRPENWGFSDQITVTANCLQGHAIHAYYYYNKADGSDGVGGQSPETICGSAPDGGHLQTIQNFITKECLENRNNELYMSKGDHCNKAEDSTSTAWWVIPMGDDEYRIRSAYGNKDLCIVRDNVIPQLQNCDAWDDADRDARWKNKDTTTSNLGNKWAKLENQGIGLPTPWMILAQGNKNGWAGETTREPEGYDQPGLGPDLEPEVIKCYGMPGCLEGGVAGFSGNGFYWWTPLGL